MKTVLKISLLFGIAASLTSCRDSSQPNYQFFPNMYESVAYETYVEHDAFKRGGMSAQDPVAGTIPRGFEPYDYPNTTEGLNAARAGLKMPMALEDIDMDKAKGLYEIYCAICHGSKGDGKGPLVQKEKFLGVPSYADRVLTEGGVYHVQTYGLNSMGSYKNQLDSEERWMVTAYVMKLKSEL